MTLIDKMRKQKFYKFMLKLHIIFFDDGVRRRRAVRHVIASVLCSCRELISGSGVSELFLWAWTERWGAQRLRARSGGRLRLASSKISRHPDERERKKYDQAE
ncbi:MAG: hypothetical protein ACM3QT_00060, partial [Syntrophothermus sp.]